MKKFISLSLCIMIILASIVTVNASEYDDMVSRIEPFNLLNTDDLNSPLTRSEGAKALMKLYTKTELSSSGTTSAFVDVAPDNPALPYINYARSLGFLSGVDEVHFMPDEAMNLEAFVKVAVIVLGYKDQAVELGGYPNGYMAIAGKLGILKNVVVSESGFTTENAVRIIDNMLDVNPLEPVFGTDNYKISQYTLYEQCLNFRNLVSYTGRVNAVDKVYLSGYTWLDDGQIMVGNKIFKCSVSDRYSFLGKQVIIRYEDKGTIPVVVSIYAEQDNKEITISANDITALDRTKCVYYADKSREKVLNFELGVTVIYNERIFSPQALTIPVNGDVTVLDSNNNGEYDVIFIHEYQSYIVDKVINVNHTVYLQDNVTFRGKNGIWFDFDNEDNEYSFYNIDGSEASFESIKENDVISVWASENEDRLKVIISRNSVSGKITEKTDETLIIEDSEYIVYKADISLIMTAIKLGDQGTYALNHKNELVGLIGESISSGSYAYVAGFKVGQGLLGSPKIRLVGSGFKEKVIDIVNNDEIIKYNYINSEITEYEFASKVMYSVGGGSKTSYASSQLTSAMLDRMAVCYTLDSDGKIKSVDVNSVPIYEIANLATNYKYSFNGNLNSFGGYINKPAFYIGETTNVICIPTNNSPSVADYGVDVTITDGSSCVIMPVDINNDTQIASMVILYEEMNANNPKPITASDDVSVVGNINQSINKDGELVYNLEVLNGDTIEKLYTYDTSSIAATVSTLKIGDLIQYNKKSNGELGNISSLQSLSTLGNQFFVDKEGRENETVYGIVESIDNDRLDNLKNERVDYVTVDISGRQKSYTLPREDGPVIYTYNRRTKIVSSAIPEEIQGRDKAGGGASKVFMLVNQNEPVAVINIIE